MRRTSVRDSGRRLAHRRHAQLGSASPSGGGNPAAIRYRDSANFRATIHDPETSVR